jgi:hypothetical protein
MLLFFAVLWICKFSWPLFVYSMRSSQPSPGHVVSVSAQGTQSLVTLWQFVHGNLLDAQVTLPLTPLGTAADGLSTTYLYQALNNVVTDQTNDGVTQVVTFGSATPRTIVASASGWVENLPSQGHMIACSLINSAEGNCIAVGPTTTSTGSTVAPTPEVLRVQVATSTPLTTTPPPPSQTITLTSTAQVSAPSNTVQPENSSKKSTSVGAIVGGVIGGLAGLSTPLVLFLLWRRHRLQELKAAGTISAYDVGVEGSYTILDSDSSRATVGRTDLEAAGVARAQIATSSSVNVNTSSQGASSSELEIAPRSQHITMAEIASRSRRLETNNNHTEPPPIYAE